MTPITQALIDRVRDAGILGGRSGLPTHQKLSQAVELVIANAASAEPLARADAHLVQHHADDVILGLKLAMQVTGARRGVLVLKPGDEAAIAAANKAVNEDGYAKFHVDVHLAPPRYAIDDERALIEALSEGKSAVVLNAMTLYHVSESNRGQSMTRRLVTVTGMVQAPRTFWAPLGAPLSTLVEAAGGPSDSAEMVLLAGGPLRGRLASPDEVVTATTATLALLPTDHRLVRRRQVPMRVDLRRAQGSCHSCQACTDLCPVTQQGSALQPHKVMRALHVPFEADVAVFAATLDCTGCNLCTYYACPGELSPGRLVMEVQARQRAAGRSRVTTSSVRPRPRLLVPLGRLAKRLGLSGMDFLAPFEPREFKVRRIGLPLSQGPGMDLVPSVRVGDRVTFAQIVARPSADSRAVPVHAGLAGVVRSLDDAIVIEEIR